MLQSRTPHLPTNKALTANQSLAIDDFGTGYSSLSYIKRLPIDMIKIDRSFVSDLAGDSDNIAIVAAIISMAHDLDLNVVAEGVESEQQLEFLSNLLCDEMQGHLFSRPVSAAEAGELLKRDVRLPSPCPPSAESVASSGTR
ncbi:MAG: EAL domain-containing protein [Proteobacteria bacterium]|nr:MAG: EAL domain-containing protein [Pseudomonadota bacterium]